MRHFPNGLECLRCAIVMRLPCIPEIEKKLNETMVRWQNAEEHVRMISIYLPSIRHLNLFSANIECCKRIYPLYLAPSHSKSVRQDHAVVKHRLPTTDLYSVGTPCRLISPHLILAMMTTHRAGWPETSLVKQRTCINNTSSSLDVALLVVIKRQNKQKNVNK